VSIVTDSASDVQPPVALATAALATAALATAALATGALATGAEWGGRVAAPPPANATAYSCP